MQLDLSPSLRNLPQDITHTARALVVRVRVRGECAPSYSPDAHPSVQPALSSSWDRRHSKTGRSFACDAAASGGHLREGRALTSTVQKHKRSKLPLHPVLFLTSSAREAHGLGRSRGVDEAARAVAAWAVRPEIQRAIVPAPTPSRKPRLQRRPVLQIRSPAP